MKTAISTMEIVRRNFRDDQGTIRYRPDPPQRDSHVPSVSKTRSSLAPLKAEMEIWAELVHEGEEDPIGHDRLYLHLSLSLYRVFIGRPASELIDKTCDSPEELHLWLASVRKTLLAANRFGIVRRFPDETITAVFSPLFDSLAALKKVLDHDFAARVAIYERSCAAAQPLIQHPRFTAGLR